MVFNGKTHSVQVPITSLQDLTKSLTEQLSIAFAFSLTYYDPDFDFFRDLKNPKDLPVAAEVVRLKVVENWNQGEIRFRDFESKIFSDRIFPLFQPQRLPNLQPQPHLLPPLQLNELTKKWRSQNNRSRFRRKKRKRKKNQELRLQVRIFAFYEAIYWVSLNFHLNLQLIP